MSRLLSVCQWNIRICDTYYPDISGSCTPRSVTGCAPQTCLIYDIIQLSVAWLMTYIVKLLLVFTCSALRGRKLEGHQTCRQIWLARDLGWPTPFLHLLTLIDLLMVNILWPRLCVLFLIMLSDTIDSQVSTTEQKYQLRNEMRQSIISALIGQAIHTTLWCLLINALLYVWGQSLTGLQIFDLCNFTFIHNKQYNTLSGQWLFIS